MKLIDKLFEWMMAPVAIAALIYYGWLKNGCPSLKTILRIHNESKEQE